MKIIRLLVLNVLFLAGALGLGAAVRFDSLDMDDGSTALFQANVDAPVYGSYRASLIGNLEKKTISHLTYFPERITWLGATGELQIQNRFGVFRQKVGVSAPEAVKGFPNFVNGGDIPGGKLGLVQTSPNGRWMVWLRATSPAFGDLVLLDISKGQETVLSQGIELNFKDLPVRWAGDSGTLIYEKSNKLYYLNISQFEDGRLLPENLRNLGDGRISAVVWGKQNQIFFLSGSLVYEILSAELFTRSLYQDFLKIGRIIGRLPFVFDSNFDRFWISYDGSTILVDRNEQSLHLLSLKTDDSSKDGVATQLPYLQIPRNAEVRSVLWSSLDTLSVFTAVRGVPGTNGVMYRLTTSVGKKDYRFTSSSMNDVRDIIMGPNDQLAAVLHDTSIEIRAFESWKLIGTIQHADPLSLLWIADDTFIVGGKWYTERVTLTPSAAAGLDSAAPSGTATTPTTTTAASSTKPAAQPVSIIKARTFLFFSQAEQMGFDKITGLPAIQAKDRAMLLDKGVWIDRNPFAIRTPQTSNGFYRTYLEALYAGPYENVIMIRKVKELGTFQLFATPKTSYEAFPAAEDTPVSYDYFEHGLRTRERAVSLTFNAIDNADGLDRILSTLKDFGVRATFFINGEFMRRYPAAVKAIADSGNEVGNLFFTYFNLSDSRFKLDADFITQGLGRNEDDYFDITGKELGLLWRTPYYIENDDVIKASKTLNYTLVGRDVDSMDWVSKSSQSGASSQYQKSAVLIEHVVKDKQPGSVIALTVGRTGFDDNPEIVRDDYVFDKLDVLINALIDRGYKILPVSRLIENSR